MEKLDKSCQVLKPDRIIFSNYEVILQGGQAPSYGQVYKTTTTPRTDTRTAKYLLRECNLLNKSYILNANN